MEVLEKPLPGLTRLRTAQLVAVLTDTTCGESCWNAREDVCRCECGGRNHGIHLRGENAVRACRINGYRYELVSVGNHRDLLTEGARLTAEQWLADGKTKKREYFGDPSDQIPCERSDFFWNDKGTEKPKHYIEMHELKGGGSLYAVKLATMAQCLKWKELEYFDCADERDRYHKAPAILWKRADTPS